MLETVPPNPSSTRFQEGLFSMVTGQTPVESHRILVVEDNPDLRDSLCESLDLMGFDVDSAVHGADALARLRDADTLPCLILLDLMMPVMSGFEFLEAKARDERLAGIPVLVLSAFSEQAPRTRDTVALVPKPFRLDQLLRTIEANC